VTKTNTRKHVALISAFLFLALIMAGTFFVQPAFADSVSITGPPKPYSRGRIQGFKVNFNVTNDGADARAIYDFHITLSGDSHLAIVFPTRFFSPK